MARKGSKASTRKRICKVSIYQHHGCWWIYYRDHGKSVRGNPAYPARRYYLLDWLNPFSTACFHNWDHTACPHCGVMLRINYSYEHNGFDGPSVCKACTRDLPTWESDHADGGVYSARPRYPMRLR